MSDKKKTLIVIHGCDDSTPFYIDLSDQELEFVKRLAQITEKISTSSCMPTITVDGDRNLTWYGDAAYEK